MEALSSNLIQSFLRDEEASKVEQKDIELRLVDQLDFPVESISLDANRKALMIVDYLGSHNPAFLADFLNSRSQGQIRISYEHLTRDIDGINDPRELVVLNFAKVLDIFRDVPLSPPIGFEKEREFLDI